MNTGHEKSNNDRPAQATNQRNEPRILHNGQKITGTWTAFTGFVWKCYRCHYHKLEKDKPPDWWLCRECEIKQQ